MVRIILFRHSSPVRRDSLPIRYKKDGWRVDLLTGCETALFCTPRADIKGAGVQNDLSCTPAPLSDTPCLDLVAKQEIVHQEAEPAQRKDGDGKEDLSDDPDLVVLEDVEHAPDGDDNAEDVDDFC